MKMNNCKYRREFSEDIFYSNENPAVACWFYSECCTIKGLPYAHYSDCKEEICPIKYPEILDGIEVK